MSPKTRDDHLFGPGPKRILALDGGGIRGILTLQILRRIEDLVRRRTGEPKAVLSDYFDLVGGCLFSELVAGSAGPSAGESSRLPPGVSVMKTAHAREGDHFCAWRRPGLAGASIG
jgi:hypothetical protein